MTSGVPEGPVRCGVWLSLAGRCSSDLAQLRDRQLERLDAAQGAEVQRRLQARQPVPLPDPVGQR